MATYAQVSQGSSDQNTVLELQKKLNEKGNYGLQEDGIFGPKTTDAVKKWQTQNNLQVDGIVGEQTWASLTGNTSSSSSSAATNTTTTKVPDYSAYQYDSSGNEAYNQANAMLTEAQKGLSTPTYDYDSVHAAYDKIVNRDKFSYDLNGDALYQQYKDQYTTQGKLAMMDTMGQAAALTGGYGSSYAQAAGQQVYQGYLQQLNEVVPELYQLAYDQYRQEGEDLLNQYAMTKEMADTEYGVEQDTQNAVWQNINYLTNERDTAWNNDFNTWYTAQQLGMTADETEYNRKQTAKDDLITFITSTGHIPSAEELEAAGMSSSEAQEWVNYYSESKASSGSGGSGTQGNTPVIDYKNMGYGSYNEMTEALSEIANTQGDDALYKKLEEYVGAGYLDETSFENLWIAYSTGDEKKTSIMTRDAWIRRTGSALGYEEYLKQNVNLV